jgi:hypothetical protein
MFNFHHPLSSILHPHVFSPRLCALKLRIPNSALLISRNPLQSLFQLHPQLLPLRFIRLRAEPGSARQKSSPPAKTAAVSETGPSFSSGFSSPALKEIGTIGAGELRQRDDPVLRHVTRPARTIGRDCQVVIPLRPRRQFAQGLMPAPARRPAHRLHPVPFQHRRPETRRPCSRWPSPPARRFDCVF